MAVGKDEPDPDGGGYERDRRRSLRQTLHLTNTWLSEIKEFSTLRPVNAEQAVRAVFEVLNRHVDPGQVGHVREALPTDIRRLWPETNADTARATRSTD